MMPDAPDDEGMLATEWQAFRQLWINRNRNEGEIEMVRLAFFYGARCAIHAMLRNKLAAVRMAAELRDFDRAQAPEPTTILSGG